MHKKTLWITQTAVMLALLITAQWVTSYIPKPAGQFVTGSFVNAILAVTVLVCGLSSGVTVSLISPIFACVLGIAPNVVAVPAIMAGNAAFVLTLHFLTDTKLWRQIVAWVVAAVLKFGVLYLLVVQLICGALSEWLLEAELMKKPMVAMMTASFGWPQLVTALIGGCVAWMMTPILKKALAKF